VDRPRGAIDGIVDGGGESDGGASDRAHFTRGDVLGLAFTVVVAGLVMLPVLRPGVSLGPFDLLSRFGLTHRPGVVVHNAIQADQIQQFVPWTDLVWHQVRSGQLPLWNPYNVLGTPLAFNWQTGTFSLPMLVGYLVPVRYAFTVVVLTKLVIAGTGAYTLARVLRLRPLSAALGATSFELSGPIVVHAGWSMTGVTCWSGWVLAAVVLLLRGQHRRRDVAMLAVVVALAIYGGHPESIIIVTLATAVFVVVYCIATMRAKGAGAWWRVVDIGVAGACGLVMGAPLLLPGIQLGASSARRYSIGAPAFALSHLPNVLTGGLQGSNFTNSAYVGVIVLMLAAVGARLYWHRPEVPALVAVAVLCGLLTFFGPADQVLHLFPGGHTVAWSRAVMVLPLALAILAAFGAEAVMASAKLRTLVRWMAGALIVATIMALGVFVAVHLGHARVASHHLGSLIWPAGEVVIGMAAAVAMWRWRSMRPGSDEDEGTENNGGGTQNKRRNVVVVLLIVNTSFLALSGVSFWSESSTYFSPTPPVEVLQHVVGSSLVGFGSCKPLAYTRASPHEVGIRPNANIGFGVREMAVYDPIIPESYFRAWRAISGQSSSLGRSGLGVFCARVDTVAEARTLGVGFVLEPPGKPGPIGTTLVVRTGTEGVYRVPDAGDATLVSDLPGGAQPPIDSVGTVVPVSHADAASWKVVTNSTQPQLLRLRLTDVPGWNATIDGRPLTLRSWAHGLMLEAPIPAGAHTVELHYWPEAFTVGLVLAAAVVLGLTVALVVPRRRPSLRRSSRAGT
jgi:Bacterial membrane protein YfhO